MMTLKDLYNSVPAEMQGNISISEDGLITVTGKKGAYEVYKVSGEVEISTNKVSEKTPVIIKK